MVNIIRTRRSDSVGSPRAEVGEIDTRPPFQSVRAAVSLFGDASSSPREKSLVTKKSKPLTEGDTDKDALFHLAQTEACKFKEQVENAEVTTAKALHELHEANKTVQDLRDKLKAVNQFKQSICEATEALRRKAENLEEAKSSKTEAHAGADEAEISKEYKTAILELDSAKQQLNNIRRDLDAAVEAKVTAYQQAEEAQFAIQANTERVSEISKHIAKMQESLGQVKLATKEALQEHAKISAEKACELQSRKLPKEEAEKKLRSLLQEHDPEVARNLELKLGETNAEIQVLEEELTQIRAAFSEYQRFTNSELHAAKQELMQVEEEKRSLRNLVDSLKLELGNIKRGISEAKHKEAQSQFIAKKVQGKLQHCRMELEAGLANKTNTVNASDNMVSKLEQLALETEKARQEVEELNKTIQELREEAKIAHDKAAEMETTLSSALEEAEEAEEAKTLERVARGQNKTKSESADAALASTSKHADKKVKLPQEEYKSLRERVDESKKSADVKVAVAIAQVKALIASQMEAAKKLETSLKEIEDIKVATEEALKQAEMAEAAQKGYRG
ncbi:hypothetical protein Ancab_004754 [Ancistrocladus abbreviatus]